MPVILHPDAYETWQTSDFEEAWLLVAPLPSKLMKVAPPPETVTAAQSACNRTPNLSH